MIVIAAGGLSTRFRREGYALPKIMLPLGRNHTLFDEVLNGFSAYRRSEAFVVTGRAVPQGMVPDIYRTMMEAPFPSAQPMVISVADIFRPNFEMPDTPKNVVTVDFGLRADTPMDLKPGLIPVALNCAHLGCYHVHNGADFMRAYIASRKPRLKAIFGEKVMEVAEATALVRHMRARGYRFMPRVGGQASYVTCGNPAEYRRLQANI